MKRVVFLGVGILSAVGVAAAEMIVIEPGEGETTNVTARLAGDIGISANPGASGGGIVKVVGHYNTYTGPTTNNCGTLWPSFLGQGVDYGALGNTAELVLGQGTLKYTGQAATLACPVVHTGGTGEYSVYDIGAGSSLTIGNSFASSPRLVKRGAGVLCFACTGAGSMRLGENGAAGGHLDSSTKAKLFMSFGANGEAPTKGGAAFTVAEGSLAFDSGSYLVGSSYALKIGAWTADDGEQEPNARVDVYGGTLDFLSGGGAILLADRNAYTTTTPNFRPSSTLAIHGGTVTLPADVWFGACWYAAAAGMTMNANPRFEMHGGSASCNSQLNFRMGNHNNILSEFVIDGGSLASGYFIPANKWYSGILCGSVFGGETCTNLITMAGTASVRFPKVINQRNETVLMRIADSAVFKACFLANDSGTFNLDFDGGTLLQNFSSDFALVSNTLTRVTVGPRGAVLGTDGGAYVAHVQKGIESHPDCVGDDGGVVVSNAWTTGVVRFYGINGHYGPTTLKKGIMEFAGEGLISSRGVFVLEGGTAVFANRPHTVAGFTLGKSASTTSSELKFDKSTPLVVTGTVKVKGNPSLSVVPLEADGSAATSADGCTILVAPLSESNALTVVASKCSLTSASGYLNVVADGDAAKLVIQATDPGLVPVDIRSAYWTATDGGEWTDPAGWEDGNPPEDYDMQATFNAPSGGEVAPVTIARGGVEVETINVTAGAYSFSGGGLKPLRINVNADADATFAGGAHDVDGNIYVGGGNGGFTHPKLSVSGGSLTCNALYMGYDETQTQTEAPAVEISGGAVTARTEVVVDYHGGYATNTLTMTGGRLAAPALKVGLVGTATTRKVPTAARLAFSNCTVDLGDGTLTGYGGNAVAARIEFGSGCTIRAKRIVQSSTYGCTIAFNGGTFRPTAATSSDATSGISASYMWIGEIGLNGFTIDSSEVAVENGCVEDYVPITLMLNGPDNGTPGTTYATGGGCVLFAGYNHAYYKSPIVATNNTVVIVKGLGASQAAPVTIEPGSSLRFTKAVQTYSKAVKLGRADATALTRLEFNNEDGFAATSRQCDCTELKVLSDVSVAWCERGWRGEATCPDGVYTGIVYTTAKSSVDASRFVLPEKFRSWKSLSTELVDYSATQKAIVFTVTTTGEDPDDPGHGGDEPEEPASGPLVLPAGSWDSPVALGTYNVIESLALGLCPGEFASAAVSGDVTIKSGTVWHHDFSNDLVDYDFLVVNGTLTVERGVTFDLGRTAETPPPRNFRVPVAQATGAIVAPRKLQATGTGGGFTSVDLTVDGGVLYVSPHKTGSWIIVK